MLPEYGGIFDGPVCERQRRNEPEVKILAKLPVGDDAQIEPRPDAREDGFDGVIHTGKGLADYPIVSDIDRQRYAEVYLLATELMDIEALSVAGLIAVGLVEIHDLLKGVYFVRRFVPLMVAPPVFIYRGELGLAA